MLSVQHELGKLALERLPEPPEPSFTAYRVHARSCGTQPARAPYESCVEEVRCGEGGGTNIPTYGECPRTSCREGDVTERCSKQEKRSKGQPDASLGPRGRPRPPGACAHNAARSSLLPCYIIASIPSPHAACPTRRASGIAADVRVAGVEKTKMEHQDALSCRFPVHQPRAFPLLA